MKDNYAKAYVLLSGGQDSFVCLLWTLERFDKVEAVSISYGQSHDKEIEYAKAIAENFNVPHKTYHIGSFLKEIADSSLLSDGDHNQNHNVNSSLPASFVPNRNGLFLTII
ncbi:MAG: 7-cyano-7-deazaguanine synthase, partial [Bacteroidales bacterium]|nr:7-cyano-7-deazaguanine synthase [Bacteroidales bacterium]